MFCSWLRRAAAPWLLIALAGIGVSCRRTEKPAIQRLAIVRFENMTGDNSLDWMGRAASEVIGAELAGSRRLSIIPFTTLRGINRALGARPLSAPGVSAERPAALLAHATGILYGRISRLGDRLVLDAAIYNTGTEKIERTLAADTPASGGIIPGASSLARQLDSPVRAFETRNGRALEEYCAGLESQEPGVAFSHAVAADPDFGAAYVAWARWAAGQNNRAEAERILAAAARANAVSEPERARLETIAAELRGDSAATVRALANVERLNPADQGLVRQLAQANLNARRYREAADYWKKAATIEPDDPMIWNQVGYTEMYAGNLAEARKALQEYVRLRPADPNASDSLGDVNFGLGEFGEAEKYYRLACDKDSNFNGGSELMKAARARLMTGDIRGADVIFNQYLAGRRGAGDPAIEFRQSSWEFLSGRRRPAMARLESFANAVLPSIPAGLVSQSYAQLAVWSLEMGDHGRAREFALKATATESVTAMAVMARLLTEPPATDAAWAVRVERALPGPAQEQARNLVLSYALLFAKEFQAAATPLTRAYEHSAPAPQETLPVLLAWALVETGSPDRAAPLIARNPIPEAEGADLFESLALPRLFFLRGQVLAKQSRPQDAERNYRLFLALSGPDPDGFGDEKSARQALTNSGRPAAPPPAT